MNNSQGALYFSAGIDLTQWRKNINEMRADILGISNTTIAQTRQIDNSSKILARSIAGYFSFSALAGFTQELINVRGEFQKTEIAFGTMLGSQAKAKVLMEQMVNLAAKTPFSLEEVSSGAKQLLAFQIPANEVVDTLTRMGNIASGLGVPLSRINLVYGQVKAKGKLMGDDLRQFTEAGIPMVAELAKKFNKTTAEISSMVSAGKIGFKDVQDVLFSMTNEGGMFFNLMEKQSASLSGKISNLGDAWDQMLNKIGEGNQSLLADGIDGLAYMVENYEDVAKSLVEIIAIYGTYKAAVIATTAISTAYNRTIASEIALLGISEKMKLGRAMVTQRQAEASSREAVAELASTRAKYSSLQVEVSSLAIKRQSAIQSGINASVKAQEARVQLSLARAELSAIQATGTARQIEIAQKRVESAQNTVIATQESAAIARKRALAAATEFNAAKQSLENTAQAVGIAEKTVATSAEAAQVAAKNANAIATSRLTILQNIQTLATRAGSKAQAFLNSTLLANPYALVTVLLGVLAYSIYKTVSATSELQKIQDQFAEDLKQTNVSVNEQKTKLEALIVTIKKQTTSYEQASTLLQQVNKITDNRIKGLTVEAIKTGEADAAIRSYTQTLYDNAEAMLKIQKLAEARVELKDIREDLKTFTTAEKFNQAVNPFSNDYWSLIPENEKREREQALVKIISDFEKDINKAIERGLDPTTGSSSSGSGVISDGWAKRIKNQIEALEAEAENASSSQAYYKIQEKIKKLQELLNPKAPKQDNKQFAEIIPLGSIKELQRRASLIEQAVEVAINGQVKLRKLDKYGNDTDKKGNPFLTGEIISPEEAKKRVDAINAEIKKLRILSFDDKITEAERQWNNYYKLAEFYGKEIADAQYKDLIAGSSSYLAYLEKEEAALKSKPGILTDEEKQSLVFLTDKINGLNGAKTPLQNWKNDINDALRGVVSLAEQIEILENKDAEIFQSEGGNTANYLAFKRENDAQIETKKNQIKDNYTAFLLEHQSYEEKKAAITKKFDDLRASDKTGASTKIIDKAQLEELSKLSMEILKRSADWQMAFGDMEFVSKSALKRIEQSLLKFKEVEGKTLAPTELRELENALRRVQEAQNSNPFSKIIGGFTDLKNAKDEVYNATERYNAAVKVSGANSSEAIKASEELAEADRKQAAAKKKIFDGIQDGQKIFNAVGDGLLELGDLFGGFDDATKDAIGNIMAIGNAAMDFGKALLNPSDIGGMIKAGVALIGSVFKALNGDQKKERQIKKQAASVKLLEQAYNDLAFAAERLFGSQKYDGQRDLIKNLEQQKAAIQQMMALEKDKKKSDGEKIAEYQSQIQGINQSIQTLKEGIIKDVLQTDIPSMASSIGDALIEAFSKGEDGIEAVNRAFDDMVKNILKNQLNKVLEKQMSGVYESLMNYAGFDKDGNGSFNGFSPEELEDLRDQYQIVASHGNALAEAIAAITGGAESLSEGMKGDIKGITEKTAGALEAQINAIRIYQVEAVNIQRSNQAVFMNCLNNLVLIESNTRNLIQIQQDISEMNGKMKKGLAGLT